MHCSKRLAVRNASRSQSFSVLGRDCTKVRCYKKTSLLHDNELMPSLLDQKYLLTENFTVALEALLLGQLFIFRTIFQH